MTVRHGSVALGLDVRSAPGKRGDGGVLEQMVCFLHVGAGGPDHDLLTLQGNHTTGVEERTFPQFYRIRSTSGNFYWTYF